MATARTVVLTVAVALAACGAGMRGERPMQAIAIEVVLREHSRELLSLPGVVGVAESLCDGKPCIRVYVTATTRELERQLPVTLEGYPVTVEETGEIRPLSLE